LMKVTPIMNPSQANLTNFSDNSKKMMGI